VTEPGQSPDAPAIDHEEPAAARNLDPGTPAQRAGGNLARMLWSLASFASSYGFRLGANVVLTRLLAPEVFGIMVVIHAMRLGIELLSDVGIEQNIVRHKEGLEPRFFNTAWTLQIIRGIGLTTIFLAIAPLLGSFYAIDTRIFLVIAFAPLINSLHSTAIFALVKNLQVRQRTLFELRAEATGFIVMILLALVFRNVWALVFGVLIQIGLRSLLSYRLPHPSHRLMLDRACVREILTFGRWIMITSFVMFAAGNLDRLALGKLAPFALLGVYGLARTMADIPSMMARRLTYQIIFPAMAAGRDGHAIADLAGNRMKLVLASAAIVGIGIGVSDWVIALLYDARYAQAGWMLSLLLIASWISILSNLNEGMLMGSSKPTYESGANVIRFAILGIGLLFGYGWIGFAGAIGAMMLAELGRYLFVLYGQHRMKLSFAGQDLLATAAMIGVCALWVFTRFELGFGTPWDLIEMAR
jgi:O-antigen/teichoic acid export membrane protein